MKIDATTDQIRALLRLAERDGHGRETDVSWRGREAALRGMPRALLERYESLVDAGRAPALVAIEAGTCRGCHVRLPTMLESSARRGPAIHSCPHCGRMLYAPQFVSEPTPADEGLAPRRTAAAAATRR